MKKATRVLALTCGLAILGGLLALAADPKVKSKKEADAFKAMQTTIQTATDPNVQIKAIEDFLEQFADTEFKPLLLENAMQLAQNKGDNALALTYAERLLEADPKGFEADVSIAFMTAQGAKEFDLDKADKTAKVKKYAEAAIENVKTAPKTISQMPDETWEAQKKSAVAQAWQSMGMMAVVNKQFDEAVTDFKTAVDIFPDPVAQARLGDAYLKDKKYDDAMSTFDLVLASPTAPAQAKKYAQLKKAEAAKAKEAGSK